ncbi:MAG: trypsin-like serine protease [Myxococcales bacterium]|nr:trypsin-like serine protease [Myxococcales bacterium]
MNTSRRKWVMTSFGLLALCLLALSACGKEGQIALEERPLIGGTHTEENLFRSALYLAPPTRSGCSAVRVSERHLLTAAHCVLKEDQDDFGRLYLPEIDPSFAPESALPYVNESDYTKTNGPYTLTVKRVYLHPNWSRFVHGIYRAELCGSVMTDYFHYPYPPDLALIEFDPNSLKTAMVSIAKVDASFQSPNRVVHLSGFGQTTFGADLPWPPPGLSFGKDGISDYLMNYNAWDVSYFYTDAPGALGGKYELSPADEGGPAFRYFTDPKMNGKYVVGINSCTVFFGFSHGVSIKRNAITRLDTNEHHDPALWLWSILPGGQVINRDARTPVRNSFDDGH